MQRRHFLRAGGGALLVLPIGTFLVEACYGTSGSDGDAPAGPPEGSGSNIIYTSNIDRGHSHTFPPAPAALTAPSDTQGETSVDEGHMHAVAISTAQLQDVQNGQSVTVTTGNTESHTHVLTFVRVG